MEKNIQNSFQQASVLTLKICITVAITFGIITLIQYAKAAWQDPTCDPSVDPGAAGCAVAAPLNVSSTTQTKAGALSLGALLTAKNGFKVEAGSVDLPTGTINGNEVLNGDLTEVDLKQVSADQNTGTGLDASEIDDIYVRNTGDTIAGNLLINGTFGVVGTGIVATIQGDIDLNGNLVASGVIETESTGHFKGTGFELTNVESVNNDAAGAQMGDVRTLIFFGQLDARQEKSISLAAYGIPHDGQAIIPIDLQALKCLGCNTTNSNDWKNYDPVNESNLRYERCNGGSFVGANNNRIVIQNEDVNTIGFFSVIFKYYSVPSLAQPCLFINRDF